MEKSDTPNNTPSGSLGNKLYSYYAMGLFAALTLPACLYYLCTLPFSERKRLSLIYAYNSFWLKLWCLGTGIRARVTGQNHLDMGQPFVMVSNHNNMLDIPLNAALLQLPYKTLMKQEMMKIPVMNFFFRLLCITVNRKDEQSRKQSFRKMCEHLKRGISILIYPEGTRNRTDQALTTFYDGAFRLAIQAQVPILPLTLLNVRKLQPVDTLLLTRGKVTLKILPPIPTRGLTVNDTQTLKQQVYEMMYQEISIHDASFRKHLRRTGA